MRFLLFVIFFCNVFSMFGQRDSACARIAVHMDISYHLLQKRTPFLYFENRYSAAVGAFIHKTSKKRPGYRYAYNLSAGMFNYSLSAPDLDTSNLNNLNYTYANYPEHSQLVHNRIGLNYLLLNAGVISYVKETPLYFGFQLSYFILVNSRNVKTYEPVYRTYGAYGTPGGVRTSHEQRAYFYAKQAFVPWLCMGAEKKRRQYALFGEARLNGLAFFLLSSDTSKFPRYGSTQQMYLGPFYFIIGSATIGFKRYL